MKRAAPIASVLLVASIAYALPTMTALPGSTPMPRYSIVGTVETPVPINAATMLSRGVTSDEAQMSGVIAGSSVYLENLHESLGVHPWAVYAEVRTRHARGDATVFNARLRNEGAGWGAAIHAEPIGDGANTTIGVNVETTSFAAGRVIGVNVQATDSYAGRAGGWTPQGINLQSQPSAGFTDAMRFECHSLTGIHFAPTSNDTRAIWIEGVHEVALDVGNSPIRMNAGTPIQLEATGQVTIRYVPGRIEFRMGARVLATIVTNTTASGGRLN
jgi:hypothetical protein